MAQKTVVLAADHHRNGVGGDSFYVGIVRTEVDGRMRRMLIVDFGAIGQCPIAVLDLDEADRGNIYMYPPEGESGGGNAWRGDHFTQQARLVRELVQARWDRLTGSATAKG